MSDKLYRSHNLEFSNDNGKTSTSGAITLWENNPSSPYNIGDTFQPVPDGPTLTVQKVSISDNVIGEVAGKTIRQWQINIEGSNTNNDTSNTRVIYNFNIADNEKSGSMDVTNTGKNPTLSINVGDNFIVPGIGNVTCTNVKGNNTYNDNGTISWNVTYEGSNKVQSSESLPEIKYNFSIDGSDDDITHSGSMSVVNEGSSPALNIQVGSLITVPGIGQVKCTKINGSDDYTESGSHRWTVTYEGTDADDDTSGSDYSDNTKYTLNIEKNNSGTLVKSGSKAVVNTGDTPNINIAVGETFSIPGIGNVKCTKITSNDDFSDNGSHRWTVTYEGTDADDDENTSPTTKYHFSIEKNSRNVLVHSGSIEAVNKGDSPFFTDDVEQNILIPGIGYIPCTKVSGNDSYDDDDNHLWTVVREGSDDNQDENNTKYSFSVEKNSDGIIVYSGSEEFSSRENTPSVPCSIGDKFSIPFAGSLTCTNIKSSSDETGKWTTTIEGSSAGSSSGNDNLPDEVVTTSYELNGISVRSVSGELIVLKRSGNAILKKNITVYTNSANAITSAGSSYSGGYVLSENISKETIKENNVVIKSYYKHQIEVEA